MSRKRLAPPPQEMCLLREYSSSQKGGTLIAKGVMDVEEHERFLADPDGYRPESCPRCDHDRLHRHDYRTRQLKAEQERRSTKVVRYQCANGECEAKWQVVPQLLPRYLPRSWQVVESNVIGGPRSQREAAPARTVRRWRSRLERAASFLLNVLRRCGEALLPRIDHKFPREGTVMELVQASQGGLASLAWQVHHQAPGVRVM
jgi:hypothetical protein